MKQVMMEMEQTWKSILATLEQRLPGERFNLNIRNLRCVQLDARRIVLEVANDYLRAWVSEHYRDDIAAAVAEVTGAPLAVEFALRGELLSAATQGDLFGQHGQPSGASHSTPGSMTGAPQQAHLLHGPPPGHDAPGQMPPARAPAPRSAPRRAAKARSQGRRFDLAAAPPPSTVPEPPTHMLAAMATQGPTGLRPEHTFDAFVVGPSNQFAHAAALAVAERPAENYNPLFIYGGVGLGKTHLMQAVGLSIMERYAQRVTYVTSEHFMNELITCIQNNEMTRFREHYRNGCDVLLIDDVQFIAGKERTQEEFFHTFNHLYNSHKQIILTSDKTPQEIGNLEERLQSRFSWGLMADIQRPEMETRVAILKSKALRHGFDLPDDIGLYLANHVDTNIRELEGCLRRLAAEAQLTGVEPSLELARGIVEKTGGQRTPSQTPDRIIKTVAGYFNLTVGDIKGRSRARRVAYPRQLAMYLARNHTPQSYPDLGRAFKKDHSTVISAVQKIEALLVTDPTVQGDIEALQRNL